LAEFPKPVGAGPSDALLRTAILLLGAGSATFWISLPVYMQVLLYYFTVTIFLLVFVFLFVRYQVSKYSWYLSEPQSLPSHGQLDEALQTDQLLEGLPVAVIRVNRLGDVEFANLAAQKILGRKNLDNQAFADLVEGLGRSMNERLQDAVNGEGNRTTEMGRCVRDGQEVFLQVSLLQIPCVDGECCLAVLSDKTELKMLEAQFVQSQKMEAVGQLAGGVAHDFNNLLTAINGHSDLLLMRHKSGDQDYGDLMQIRQNSIRAAALVRQLLAFSRKQTLRPKVVNIVNILRDINELLNRLLGGQVTLVIEENPSLDPVRIDAQQFEQVIMNLVVNARDAMPDGGKIIIRTKNVHLAKALKKDRATVAAGDYVTVRVSDQGCGIDKDVLPKIFEPFFTTKGVGEGTGLGLSTVYGIIKQTGGFIFARSKHGGGTHFDIYLPIYHGRETVKSHLPASVQKGVSRGSGDRILLVEDEDAVRAFAAKVLRMKGYVVDEAGNGEDALTLTREKSNQHDLIISDVVMPGLNGPGWVAEARNKGNRSKVIFVSGYSEDIFSDEKQAFKGNAFLAKPFSLGDLTKIVAKTLAED